MPTFQQCLDADPSKFTHLGTKVMSTAGEINAHTQTYSQTVTGLSRSWSGSDFQALVRWQGRVQAFNAMNQAELNAAGAVLASMGATMMATVQTLKMTKQMAEGIGYKVLPSPFVILGPSQWQQVAAANVGAPAVLAAYQAGAAAFTAALVGQYAAIIAQDVACASIIRVAAGTGA
jgi:hypothetical protein